jgi:sigma-B regulation protein RsbU (phosphoserine phosphatase)
MRGERREAKGHLLLIHSDPIERDRLARLVGGFGYTVAIADSAGQGLDAMQKADVDLILLDPRAVNRRAWHERSNGHQAPVIALVSPGGVEGAAALDSDDYLSEPIHPMVLKTRIERLLESGHLKREAERLAFELKKLTHDLRDVILPVGIALSAEKDLDRLLERIVLEAKALCNADGGTLYLRTQDDHLKFVIMHTDSLQIAMGGTTGVEIPHPPLPLYDPLTQAPNHHNVATYVALEGQSINIPDVYHADGFDFSATQAFDERNHYRTISCLTVPLKDNEGYVIGVLQVLNARSADPGTVIPFDAYLQLVTESLSSQAAVALNNHLLVLRERELIKFERDIQIGRQMQADFLPAALPAISGWELAASFQPARQVSGDFYDAFPLKDATRLALVIADVCDKGVGAALFMALIRSLLRAFSDQQYDLAADDTSRARIASAQAAALAAGLPAEVCNAELSLDAVALQNAVAATNEYIVVNHARMNMFATLFFGVLDPVSGALIYVNGGHEAPIILGRDGIRQRLKSTGPAVGMLPHIKFGLQCAQLEPGEMLFAYTDGVTDARAPDRALFTEARLLALMEQHCDLPAGATLDCVMSDISAHIATAEQFDDITMLSARRSAS